MDIRFDEPMSKYTTFRTGGPARRLVNVSSSEEVIDIIKECQESGEDYYIIGNGSNLLVSDKGYNGTIIRIYDGMDEITLDGNKIYAKAGALLSSVAKFAKENSLTGFEFAAGIPGTVGGGAIMNAGAYGGEIKDVCTYVDIIHNGNVERVSCEDMQFGYRHSRAMDEGFIVLGMEIELKPGDKNEISSYMNELAEKRRSKQPLEYPSAGSTFKRPEGYFAGKLIMDSGLAGKSVGGAMVSPKHCGFIINYDNATSTDVYELINFVRDTVYKNYNVTLETEVRLLGEF